MCAADSITPPERSDIMGTSHAGHPLKTSCDKESRVQNDASNTDFSVIYSSMLWPHRTSRFARSKHSAR
jgi:hypothetical protein